MNISTDFNGKTVLITGGTKGIGKGIATSFLNSHATVYVCARNLPKEISKESTNSAKFLKCDVNDIDRVEEIFFSYKKTNWKHRYCY